VYVAALGNNTLEVIELDAGKRIKSISGLKKPTGIRVLAGLRNAVVASGGDGKVRIYDPAEFNIAGTVDALDDADNVRLDSQGKLAYVGYGDGAIAVIDPRQPKKIGDTDALFYDAASKRIYLTGGEGCISVVEHSDADHYRALGTIPTAPGARTSLFVPELGRLYVAVPHRADQPAEIRAYDVRTGK